MSHGPSRRSADQTRRRSRWWPIVKRVLTGAFFAAVAWLLVEQARSVEWTKVGKVLADYPLTLLLAAGALAILSHAIYSSFDLLGRRWTGHELPVRQVVPITFVSYAFNLNMGSLVGGFGFRYRLYSRYGLPNDVITRVLGLSLATNWLGYLWVGGALFALRVVTPPENWKMGAGALQLVGAGMLAAGVAYVVLCATMPGREWSVRGHTVKLPPLKMALLQLVLSALNWSTMGFIIYTLLGQRIDYPTVLAVLLVAAVAGVLTHIPAGLGVLEAVFIALLAHRVPRDEILAALIAYRGLYYLLPLAIATAVYLTLEARARKAREQPAAPGAPDRQRDVAHAPASGRAS
jgi:uncharacterized membrane protein YbhN (UPF0104 family)